MNAAWIRRIAWALGVLVLLAVAAGAVLVARFDADRYKAEAIDWMRAEHQRTLAIDGPVELSLWPHLSIRLSRLRLSAPAPDDGNEAAAVGEASMAVQLWPLLGRRLVIDRIAVRGARAVFSRDADGVSNFDDFLPRPGREGDAPASRGKPLRFDLGALQFDDLQLRFHDQRAGLAGRLALQEFTAGRLGGGMAAPVALRAQVALSEPQAVDLALDGRGALALNLQTGALTLNGLQLSVQGDAAAVKGAALRIDASLAWDGSRLRVAPLQLGIDRATLAGQAFALSLAWPQLEVSAQQLQAGALDGSFRLDGPSALAGTLRAPASSGSAESWQLPGLVVTLAGQAGQRRIDATLQGDLRLQPARAALALDRLDLAATLALPGVKPLHVGLRGSATVDRTQGAWVLDGQLDADRFDSRGSAGFGGAVPRLVADARFDRLDLDRLLGTDAPDPAATAGTAGADSAVPLDALHSVEGRFEFSAKLLSLRRYRLADARVEARLAGGVLDLVRLDGRAWGGDIQASGHADVNQQRLALRLKASGVDAGALLRDVAGKDLLAGRGRVSADLVSQGGSVAALRSTLAGHAALQLRDGAFKGVNLARMLRRARAALSLRQDAITRASATEQTDFSELGVSARIAGGVASSDDLVLKSPFLRIGGAGQVDIGRGRIDYTARASVVPSAVGQGAGELAALRGLTVPVQLSGPLDAIDWQVRWSGAAASAIENRLRDKLGERLGIGAPRSGAASAPPPVRRPEEILKDRLRGLFR